MRIQVAGDTSIDACVIESTDFDLARTEILDVPFERRVRMRGGASFIHKAMQTILEAKSGSEFQIDPNDHLPSSDATELSNRIVVRMYAPDSTGSDIEKRRWRIASRVSQEQDGESNASVLHIDPEAPSPQLLVLIDCGERWQYDEGSVAETLDSRLTEMANARPTSADPLAIVYLDRKPPVPDSLALAHLCQNKTAVPADGRPLYPANVEGKKSIWNTLYKHRDRICILCSSGDLRRAGAAVRRDLSWELTVETLAAELRLFEPLRALSMFRHLVIRFGWVGAVHLQRNIDDGALQGQLVFAPLARDGTYRVESDEGDIVGMKTVVASAIARELSRDDTPNRSSMELMGEALRSSILAGMMMFDKGYDVPGMIKQDQESPYGDGDYLLSNNFEYAVKPVAMGYAKYRSDKSGNGKRGGSTNATKEHAVGIVPIPQEILVEAHRPLAHFGMSEQRDPQWQILRESLNSLGGLHVRGLRTPPTVESLTWRINVGMAIVRFGYDAVLNCDLDSRLGKAPGGSTDHRHPATTIDECICRELHQCERWPGFVDLHDCVTNRFGDLPDIPMPGVLVPQVNPEWSNGLFVPMMRFENLVLVERSEIESFRSVRNSIREYAAHADDSSSNRPLSIAMFGPPGTGKSFAVGQLVASVNRSLRKSDRKLELLKFNVSQFSDLNDLSLAAQYISNTNHDGRVPVAFFDEFDCERNGESLGWLRYFLTPMQDGYLRGAKAPIKLGPAVLMFAGGVFHCFDQFVPGESHTITGEFSPEQSDAVREFRQRKGPDFVSRLSSHIDILPIDRAPNEYKAIVRRSLLLRGFLQRHGYIEMRGGLGVARIDRDVLYALLTMDRYRHGIRSMETVIAMCASKSKWLDKGALPPDVQLDMHLDVREFMIRMYRGRVRHSGQYETHTFGVQGSDDQLSTHGQFGDDDPQVSPGVKARKGKRSSPEPKSGSETGKPDTPAARKKTKRKRK